MENSNISNLINQIPNYGDFVDTLSCILTISGVVVAIVVAVIGALNIRANIKYEKGINKYKTEIRKNEDELNNLKKALQKNNEDFKKHIINSYEEKINDLSEENIYNKNLAIAIANLHIGGTYYKEFYQKYKDDILANMIYDANVFNNINSCYNRLAENEVAEHVSDEELITAINCYIFVVNNRNIKDGHHYYFSSLYYDSYTYEISVFVHEACKRDQLLESLIECMDNVLLSVLIDLGCENEEHLLKFSPSDIRFLHYTSLLLCYGYFLINNDRKELGIKYLERYVSLKKNGPIGFFDEKENVLKELIDFYQTDSAKKEKYETLNQTKTR